MSEATTRTIRYVTADELLVMPEDGFRRELVGGEVRTLTPTGSRHGGIVAELTAVLHHHVMTNSLGQVFGAETGFRLASNPDTVRAPDVAFVRRERMPPGDLPEQFWPGPPDLAVEVLSPGDRIYEVEEKVDDWLQATALAVWVVNPRRRTVTVYRAGQPPRIRTEADMLDGEEFLPGFAFEVARLFRPSGEG